MQIYCKLLFHKLRSTFQTQQQMHVVMARNG